MEHGDQQLNFDLDDGDYIEFIHRLRHKLAYHPHRDNYIARYGDWVEDRPLLPEQRSPSRPARWIYIHLTVREQNTRAVVTLALRDDNVYFIGFKNRDGSWYEFGLPERSARLLPGSTFLGCNVSYGALVGSEGLVNLDLGKEAMKRAVFQLWAYKPVGLADPGTRKDLARLCFMICEAARMAPHLQTVGGDGWIDGSTFEQLHVTYAQSWSKMSRELFYCALNDRPRLSTLVEFGVVHLVLNSRRPGSSDGPQQWTRPGEGGSGSSDSQQRRRRWRQAASRSGGGGGGTQQQQQQGRTAGKSVQGRPLLQVYGVCILDGTAVDTIAVFDGKRGQIIYKNDQRTQLRSSSRYVEVTAPYRAISAEGTVAIQVYGITSGADASDESKRVIGEMLWDCYAKNVKYDKVLTRDIISRIGTGQHTLGDVRYAVWSHAVEATVEANLLLPGPTSVFGEVSAFHQTLEYHKQMIVIIRPNWEKEVERVVLFERGPGDEKVELVPSAADSMVPLELGRYVIAVPLSSRYSHLWIDVDLHVALPSNKEGDVRLFGRVHFYLDKDTGEIRVKQNADFLVPVGWTKGSNPAPAGGASGSASPQGTGQTSSEQQVKVQVNITSPGFHTSPLEPDIHWYRGVDEYMRMDEYMESDDDF